MTKSGGIKYRILIGVGVLCYILIFGMLIFGRFSDLIPEKYFSPILFTGLFSGMIFVFLGRYYQYKGQGESRKMLDIKRGIVLVAILFPLIILTSIMSSVSPFTTSKTMYDDHVSLPHNNSREHISLEGSSPRPLSLDHKRKVMEEGWKFEVEYEGNATISVFKVVKDPWDPEEEIVVFHEENTTEGKCRIKFKEEMGGGYIYLRNENDSNVDVRIKITHLNAPSPVNFYIEMVLYGLIIISIISAIVYSIIQLKRQRKGQGKKEKDEVEERSDHPKDP